MAGHLVLVQTIEVRILVGELKLNSTPFGYMVKGLFVWKILLQ